jgi:hypothetical protein
MQISRLAVAHPFGKLYASGGGDCFFRRATLFDPHLFFRIGTGASNFEEEEECERQVTIESSQSFDSVRLRCQLLAAWSTTNCKPLHEITARKACIL